LPKNGLKSATQLGKPGKMLIFELCVEVEERPETQTLMHPDHDDITPHFADCQRGIPANQPNRRNGFLMSQYYSQFK